jgi:hypothetical protein
MISPAQQQLDEALTNAGHNDTCPAFEGHRCPGYPACGGNPVDDALYAAVGADRAAEQAKRPRLVSEVKDHIAAGVNEMRARIAAGEGPKCRLCGAPYGTDEPHHCIGENALVFTGAQAAAIERWKVAARRLKAISAEHQAAQREYQEAHQAAADAVAGA